MIYPLFFLVSVVSWILLVVSAKINGRIYTETEATSGVGFFLTRMAKTITIIMFFLSIFVLVHPIFQAINWDAALGQFIRQMGNFGQSMTGLWWMWIAFPSVLIITGLAANLIFANWARKRFGLAKPDYGNWPGFTERAERKHSSTSIWINSHSWSPVRSQQKPSLSQRLSARTQSGSRYTGGVLTSVRHSFVPSAPVRHTSVLTSTRHTSGGSRGGSKSKSRSSSGSKSSGGLGTAIAAAIAAIIKFLQTILMVLFQIVIVLFLLGIMALFLYIAYKATDAMYDYFDEESLLPTTE